jgi:hypothetical protein
MGGATPTGLLSPIPDTLSLTYHNQGTLTMSSTESKILEMDARSDEFWLYRSYRSGQYNLHVKFNNGEERAELKFEGDSIHQVVEKAHARFVHLLNQMPEFDANRAITHLHSEPIEPLSEELPF